MISIPEIGMLEKILAKEAAERHSRIYKLEDTHFDPVVHYADESEIDEKLAQALIKSLEWGT